MRTTLCSICFLPLPVQARSSPMEFWSKTWWESLTYRIQTSSETVDLVATIESASIQSRMDLRPAWLLSRTVQLNRWWLTTWLSSQTKETWKSVQQPQCSPSSLFWLKACLKGHLKKCRSKDSIWLATSSTIRGLSWRLSCKIWLCQILTWEQTMETTFCCFTTQMTVPKLPSIILKYRQTAS